MSLADVTQIEVNLAAPAVSRSGFQTLLIAGTTAPVAVVPEGEVREYGDISEMDEAGWAGTEDEYAAAQDAFSNDAPSVKVAHLADFVVKVLTVTITGNENGNYDITVDDAQGRTHTGSHAASGDTISDIHAALLADLQASEFDTGGHITFGGVAPDITMTADNAGYEFDAELGGNQSANMSLATTNAGTSYGTELATIDLFDDDWFGLVGVDDDAYHIGARAEWLEARNKGIHIARTSEAAVKDAGSSTDIGSLLQAAGYARTAVIYHESANEYVDAAWLAITLAIDADTQATEWGGKDLSSITKQPFTSGVQNILEGKNVNYYGFLDANTGATYKGQAADGTWLDLVLASDWLKARLSEDIRALWSAESNAGRRLANTNEGRNKVETKVRERVAIGQDIGWLSRGTPNSNTDPEPSFDFPTRAEADPADNAARIFRFSGTVGAQGALISFRGQITLLGA